MAKTVKVNDLAELLNAVSTISEDDTIQLQSNITLDQQILFRITCVLDLNEYKISTNVSQAMVVDQATRVTIRNGSILSTKDDLFVVDGEGSVFTIADRLKVKCETSAIWAKNKGKVIVDGACIRSEGTYPAAFIDGYGATGDFLSGVIMSSGENVISVKNGGTAFIGGTMQVLSDCLEDDPATAFCAVYANGASSEPYKPSVVIITGCAHIHSKYTCALAITDGSECSIESGRICSKSTTQPTISLQGADSVLRMIGGVVTSSGDDGIRVSGLDEGESSILDVVGGKIFAEAGQVVTHVGDGEPNISVIGIEFKGELDPKYLPPGYVIVDGKIYPEDEAPEPEPEPEPGPEPEPEPEPQPEPEPIPIEIGDSFGIVEPINIYVGPSIRAYSTKFKGSLTVVSMGFHDWAMREFLGVEYKLPGNGKRLFGFVLKTDIERVRR